MLSGGACGTENCALARWNADRGSTPDGGATPGHEGLRGIYNADGCSGGVCASSAFGQGPRGGEAGGGTRSGGHRREGRCSTAACFVACEARHRSCRKRYASSESCGQFRGKFSGGCRSSAIPTSTAASGGDGCSE